MGVSAPYVLNGLTPEESWDLLKKITFGDDTMGVNQTLESIGKKIAEKCRGVPLAIRTLGAYYKIKMKKVNGLVFYKLPRLVTSRKKCFAYCSLYPKDWEIEKDELIEMWMAHGYLESSIEGKLMEDVGNQFVRLF
ncbi:P-loop containing nucleoside triphosphate hydrolase [Sesbania bispinosa]|nr:P-loop containing nucleoside triphosphate hydrolase [Sesbania bispinosa]